MASYSIDGDLDIIANSKPDDDFSTSLSDLPNLGTFDDDSPSKELPKNYAQRRPSSPPRCSPRDTSYNDRYNYKSSPKYSRQQDTYYSSYTRSYNIYHGYHQSRYNEQSWTSPQAYNYSAEKEQIPPPPRDYDQGNITSSPIRKKARWDRDRTPDRQTKTSKSPFRSPALQNTGSSKKYKRSPPIWGGGSTPNIGMYGSFDTPGGLDEFSPMGPVFKAFEKGESPQIPMEGEVQNLENRLNLASENTPLPPMRNQRHGDHSKRHGSPDFNFMNELTNIPGTMPVPSSPMRSSNRDREYSRYYSEKDRGRPPRSTHSLTKQIPPSTSTKRHMFASPMVPSHHSSSKRSPWYDSSRQNPGPVRLELGDIGKPSERSRSLEGINNMVRGNHHSSSGHHGYNNMEPMRGHGYRGDLNTPVKIGQSRLPLSHSRSHVTPYPPQPPGSRATPITNSGSHYPTQSANLSHSAKQSRSQQSSMKTPSTSKEKVVTPASARRNPCNCKKSKCLKLYCECFAAELFCDGCNCNDCRNTKEHDDIRSKAMKDTRAKNPNAFKPRIAVRNNNTGPTGVSPPSAHNMGCKCKRSECLKKYCECFQAGVMCGNKCKCVECLNYVGSQALIDKRRKIKDHRGADFAMRIADEAWKKGKHGHPPPMSSNTKSHTRHHVPSSASSHPSHGGQYPPLHPHMMHPNPPQHGPHGSMYPLMMGHPQHPHMGYSPMPMHPTSKPYTHGQKSLPQPRKRGPSTTSQVSYRHRNERRSVEHRITENPSYGELKPSVKTEPEEKMVAKPSTSPSNTDQSGKLVNKEIEKTHALTKAIVSNTVTRTSADTANPSPNTVRDAVVVKPKTIFKCESVTETKTISHANTALRTRLGYDPASSKKKRKLSLGENEATFSYFGNFPEQPKTTALNVFSFLSNDEIYNTGLVCKSWNGLAMDEELWQF
eukprot:CAMPEP_0194193048 /NCGR_PEP_ID=MMETSP0154-20130528/73131_1 /TAXON_ID=1049557 /ORGANISM="Thalassiothrix antarctica, Strain L6-D1" /LENGTH=936 /DNA_ID=CAMNT_0038916989 /DNA_START=381 /DNA_END=3191 /DNA_ORIENTATION=+